MNLKKSTREEELSYRGRCVLMLSVSALFSEVDSNINTAQSRIKDSVCELYDYALCTLRDIYFKRAKDKLDLCLLEKETFYPYRVSIDISYQKTVAGDNCTVKKKSKKPCHCQGGGCVLYELSCRLFCHGRLEAKKRLLFAFRLSDGYICKYY